MTCLGASVSCDGRKETGRFRRLPARSGHPCIRKQMVLDTVSLTVETTVESQFSTTVSEGDL